MSKGDKVVMDLELGNYLVQDNQAVAIMRVMGQYFSDILIDYYRIDHIDPSIAYEEEFDSFIKSVSSLGKDIVSLGIQLQNLTFNPDGTVNEVEFL